jgi:iron complex outermembrane receptor protein
MRAVFVAAFTLGVVHATARASTAVEAPQALKKLSLEELFDLEVTTVSQKPESLSKTAAAVHVVTQDDLRRSGALSISEALRAIPGVEVAQIDARQYAITARGFNGTIANKLLVLIDGRSVYTPLFSGVFWDVQDVFMEDVEQIEVIRGPGATVWGANAVNGVINVISKDASQTQGFLVSGGAGDFENGFGGARYGGMLGSRASFRIYGKYFDRGPSVRPNGQEAVDTFRMGQGGMRVDWSPTASDRVTFQGDGYGGHEDQATAGPVDVGGANAIVRWTRQLSATSDLQLRAYVDHTDRDNPPTFAEILDTYDAELRHRFAPASGHDLVWGATYRRTHDDVHNSPVLAFLPARVSHELYSGFVQDEWTTAQSRLRLTLGSKFEHNDYSGLEIQPSGRLAWSASNDQTIWGAVSRAVRAPSRIDRDLYSPAVPPYLLAGGPDFESEVLLAYELGYKFQPLKTVTASIATYHNRYSKLRSLEGGPPYVLGNGLRAKASGVETELNWQPTRGWRFDLGYTYLWLDLSREPGSTDVSQIAQEGDSPRHQGYVRSSLTVARALEFDFTTRYVSELENQQVPCYVAADMHLGWQPVHALELGLYGRNLFDRSHPEFGRPASRREVPRSLFAKVTCRF